MACLAKCYPFGVCVCVWKRLQWHYFGSEDQNHEPSWRRATSAARNKTRNKCFMKQTYTSLPYFFGCQFAASSCIQSPQFLHFFLFLKHTQERTRERERERKQSHIVISDCKTSDLPLIPVPQRGFRRWPVSPLKTCVYIHLVNHVNRSKIFGINKHLKECHSWFLSVTVISPVQS